MLCNASNVRTGETGGKIARVYLGEAAQATVEPLEAEVPLEELSKKAGLYRNMQTGVPMRLALEDGRLEANGTVLVPLSPQEFQAGADGPRFVFEAAASGGRPSMRVIRMQSDERSFEPVAEFEPSASELRAFEGEYESDDAETVLVLSVVDGKLTAHRRPDWKVTLSPFYADAFDGSELGLVRFHRDLKGRVVELSLRQGRVYDMRFERVAKAERPSPSR